MVKATVGEKVFLDFLKKNLQKNLPENYIGTYSDKTPIPNHFFICKLNTKIKKVLFGLFEDEVVRYYPVGELKKFPGCRAKADWDENNDQQCLHIIVMDDTADEVLLDLADAFEDAFGLEAEVEDSPKLLAEIRAKREGPTGQS